MSAPSAPDLGTLINNVVSALISVFQSVVTAISENASTIATLIVVGGIAYMVFRYGKRYLSGLMDWFKGLI